ncbi:MAG: hypothetical protein F9K25_14035 [Candidatus Contendobacter sp.]|nr:MAG: hypothetical protein F9K25_14035 [Candidatus Contendobacter sp.]
MWFFFRRSREQQQAPTDPQADVRIQVRPARPRPLSYEQIAHSFGDFSDFRTHDVALKFWLPEPAEQALTEFCTHADQSLSEWLRQFFVVYAYGLLALTILEDRYPGFFRDPPPLRYSIARSNDSPGKKRVYTYCIPELGKNVAPIKVWIPARMKADLQLLADHAEIPLSQFIREIVISRLLGHGTLPARPVLTRAEPTAADAWCDDQGVLWRQVNVEEYRHHREGEVCWNYEDVIPITDRFYYFSADKIKSKLVKEATWLGRID